MTDPRKDLETMLGDPRKAIRSMAVPLIFSYLIVQINIFADTSWCSGLGSDASSAVSTISPIYWIISGLGTGIGVGASTAIARCLGRDERSKAESLATQTVVLSLIISAIFTPMLFILVDPGVIGVGARDVLELCEAYICPIVLLTVFVIMEGTVSGILRSEGAAKKSMVMLCLSAMVNMVLDPLLIYGAGLGLAGAGLATGLATVFSSALGLYWCLSGESYVRISFRGFRFKRREVWDVLYVGIPRATESILVSMMSLIQRIFVIACGGIEGAMFYNIPWRFVSLACVISMAVGAAMIPVCSAAFGRKDLDKAMAAYRYSILISVSSMSIIAVLLFIFSDMCVIPFTYSPTMEELRPEFAHVLRIYAPMVVCMAFVDMGSSMLQALRRAQVSMVSSFIRNLVIVAILWYASTMSMDAIYYGLLISEVFGGALMMYLAHVETTRYRRSNTVNTPG